MKDLFAFAFSGIFIVLSAIALSTGLDFVPAILAMITAIEYWQYVLLTFGFLILAALWLKY